MFMNKYNRQFLVATGYPLTLRIDYIVFLGEHFLNFTQNNSAKRSKHQQTDSIYPPAQSFSSYTKKGKKHILRIHISLTAGDQSYIRTALFYSRLCVLDSTTHI